MQPLVDLLEIAETLLATPNPPSLRELLRVASDLHAASEHLHIAGDLTAEEQGQFDAAMNYARELQGKHRTLYEQDQAAARSVALESSRGTFQPQDTRLHSTWSPRSSAQVGRLNGSFESFGQFLQAVAGSARPGVLADERLQITAQMNIADPTQGGFLVPQSFNDQLVTTLLQAPTSLLSRCTILPVPQGDTIVVPMSAEVSRASGSRFGGVASHWLGELEILADSMPTLRNVTLTYNELGTLVYVTERLLRSAPALEAYVRKAALDDQQWEINRAIVAGSGVGQPLGILNSAALITTPLPEPTSTALTVADVNAMYSRLLPQCRPNAVWLFHPDLLEQLEALNIESPGGATLWPIFLPASGGVVSLSGTPIPLSGGTATLKGRPMIESEACNAPGNPGDLVLADLSMVAAIVRGSFEMSSPHVRFEMRQSAFRFITDFESQPLINSPIAPASGTLTRSPFVVLAERLP